MIRTQIQLSETQARLVRAQARGRGISMAEFIRQSIDHELEGTADRPDRWALAEGLVGAFGDKEGRTDLSRRHDELLEDGF